jgi:hypothetical protein
MSFAYIHGENLIIVMVALYGLAIIGWTAICWSLIKLWQNRRKKK